MAFNLGEENKTSCLQNVVLILDSGYVVDFTEYNIPSIIQVQQSMKRNSGMLELVCAGC